MRHSLPSWNDGAARQSIIDFVTAVMREGAPSFVPPSDRIAVFDNDGTLRAEKPVGFVPEAGVITPFGGSNYGAGDHFHNPLQIGSGRGCHPGGGAWSFLY